MPELIPLQILARQLLARLAAGRDDGRGSVTLETVLIAAGLAAIAIAVVAIIGAKIINKANNIPTGS